MQKRPKQKALLSFLSIKQPKIPHYSLIEEMRHLLTNKPFSIPIRIFVLIIISSFIILGITLRVLPPLVPLYYSLPWGEEQLVRTSQLFILPFTTLLVFVINLLLILFIANKDRFITLLILWGNCFIALIGAITLFKIILLVI